MVISIRLKIALSIVQFNLGFAILSIALILPNLASATTDWTNFLKPMTNNCDGVGMEEIPKSLQPSIVSKKSKKMKNSELPDHTITTYQLKNASAFGYPLIKIEDSISDWGGGITLFFGTSDFVKLRPKFTFTPRKGIRITDNNVNGYSYEVTDDAEQTTSLIFDKKTKSIECSSLS